MRKEAGFEVMDKIRVSVKDNDKIIETMKANEAEINLKFWLRKSFMARQMVM